MLAGRSPDCVVSRAKPPSGRAWHGVCSIWTVPSGSRRFGTGVALLLIRVTWGEAGVGAKAVMLSSLRQAFLMPFWMAQVFSQEKFFARNPIIGNLWLNEHGLHTARVAAAYRLSQARRRRLARLIPEEDRRRLDRDGFIVKRDFLPARHLRGACGAGPRSARAGARDGRRRHDHPPHRARPRRARQSAGRATPARVAAIPQPDQLCRIVVGDADGLPADDPQRRPSPGRPIRRPISIRTHSTRRSRLGCS